MYFNRYLLVRYVSALFFFTNLYWFMALLMSDSRLYFIPLSLLVVLVISTSEQVKMYSKHANIAKKTKYCFRILLATNAVLLIPMFFTSAFTALFPFFLYQGKSILLISAILIAGMALSLWMLHRLNKIELNEDKHFKRMKHYEEAIN